MLNPYDFLNVTRNSERIARGRDPQKKKLKINSLMKVNGNKKERQKECLFLMINKRIKTHLNRIHNYRQ